MPKVAADQHNLKTNRESQHKASLSVSDFQPSILQKLQNYAFRNKVDIKGIVAA